MRLPRVLTCTYAALVCCSAVLLIQFMETTALRCNRIGAFKPTTDESGICNCHYYTCTYYRRLNVWFVRYFKCRIPPWLNGSVTAHFDENSRRCVLTPSTTMAPTTDSTDASNLTSSTTMSPNSTTMSPNSTTMSPNSTTMSPNSSTMSPNSTTMSPNSTTMSLNSTTMSSNSTTMSPNSTTISPNSTTMSPNSTTIGSTSSTTIGPTISTTLGPSTTDDGNIPDPTTDEDLNP